MNGRIDFAKNDKRTQVFKAHDEVHINIFDSNGKLIYQGELKIPKDMMVPRDCYVYLRQNVKAGGKVHLDSFLRARIGKAKAYDDRESLFEELIEACLFDQNLVHKVDSHGFATYLKRPPVLTWN